MNRRKLLKGVGLTAAATAVSAPAIAQSAPTFALAAHSTAHARCSARQLPISPSKNSRSAFLVPVKSRCESTYDNYMIRKIRG